MASLSQFLNDAVKLSLDLLPQKNLFHAPNLLHRLIFLFFNLEMGRDHGGQ